MERKKCEELLLRLLETAVEIYHVYNPVGVHMALTYVDGVLSVSDAVRDENGDYVDPTQDWNGAHTIYADRFVDGKTYYGEDWEKRFLHLERMRKGAR